MSALSVDQHRAFLAQLVAPVEPVRLPLDECVGLVLAEPVRARVPVPPFTNSAMDGFAVRAADLATKASTEPGSAVATLPVVGDIAAGSTVPAHLEPGTAMRIMTGAPLPDGADTVVKVELTDHSGRGNAPASVAINDDAPAYANIRVVGESVEVGASVLSAGHVLDAAALSAAASVGYGHLLVFRRPRVAIVTTGDELVEPGAEFAYGQVPDSNGVLLRALVREAGAEVSASIRCGDRPEDLLSALEEQSDIDLIITAGGISAGAFEVVRQAFEPEVRFYHVAQQPGGPQGAGVVSFDDGHRVPAVCLPGNPVSVFVSFHVYIRGILAHMRGETPCVEAPATVRARAGQDWQSPKGRTQFIPLRLETARESTPLVPVSSADPAQGTASTPQWAAFPAHPLGSKSHLVTALPLADAIGVVPAGGADTGIRLGNDIDVIPIRPLPTPN